MFRYVCGVIFACVPLVAANAESPKFCRNSIKLNEPIETRFMGIDYALMVHVLAEKYCGAEPKPMRPRFLGYIQKQGCPPGTQIYSDVEEAIAKLEGASLQFLAETEVPDLPISERQAQEWASSVTKELGGCDALKNAHDAELQR
ncbi:MULTISPECIES: hypothetical protein [unclassified Rhizobium]|uniref:hypothetical protein n=1 Tax=unclassified Rhizobium TaxID=2613769 RepID=UPI001C837081|nr:MULTISPECIES: hypothetical protein [unclassified Rhizobium]MBX5165225.1 hypothetical protein [Rhizobium sp. NZLR4b]MBX5172805.1 hypothetical protein [Rhizobium sp. NZLR1b]MBX5185108.1 hypothetical protein [Rhizobium sp. NZLR5]MBX5197656.1 hypothetical protein [Rhizobium sp. NZLR10]MBX5208935.1 hypothetical protein [Rhizobium sp. NZLR11]